MRYLSLVGLILCMILVGVEGSQAQQSNSVGPSLGLSVINVGAVAANGGTVTVNLPVGPKSTVYNALISYTCYFTSLGVAEYTIYYVASWDSSGTILASGLNTAAVSKNIALGVGDDARALTTIVLASGRTGNTPTMTVTNSDATHAVAASSMVVQYFPVPDGQ